MMKPARFAIALLFAAATVALGNDLPLTTPTTLPANEPAAQRRAVESGGEKVEYLVTPPQSPTPREKRWMLVFLHGAGGSLKGYNLARPPYAPLRARLSQAGATVVVPGLGPLHFMNDAAKTNLDRVIAQACAEEGIDPGRVHLMGASMGAGSVLAYAANRPGAVRSVIALFPMTDFAAWGAERPKYMERMKVAFGGTPEEKPEAYAANSAVAHADVLAKIPVYLLHGTADRTVPIGHSERLAAAIAAKGGDRCTLVKAEGVAHVDAIVEGHQDAMAQFLIDANR